MKKYILWFIFLLILSLIYFYFYSLDNNKNNIKNNILIEKEQIKWPYFTVLPHHLITKEKLMIFINIFHWNIKI